MISNKKCIITGIILMFFLFLTSCASPPEEVELRKAKDVLEISLEGVVQPAQEGPIVAPISGKIVKVYAKSGDRVSQTQILAEYDNYELILNHRSAILQYERNRINARQYGVIAVTSLDTIANARDRLMKTYDLYRNGYASLAELKAAEDNYFNLRDSEINRQEAARRDSYISSKARDEALKEAERSRVEVERTRYLLNNTRFKAPISGIITDLNLRPGQTAHQGEALGKVVVLESVVLKVGFTSGIYRYLRKGMTMDINCMSSPPLKTQGQISDITPVADSSTQRMSLYIPLKNDDYLLQPGTKCMVNLVIPTPPKSGPKEESTPAKDKVSFNSQVKSPG